MIELQGTYNTAKIFTDTTEPGAIAQIRHILNQPFVEGSQIRVMPDVHSGQVGTVGMTMTITDKIVPNLVGTDGCCGMFVALIKEKRVDPNQLDKAIIKNIPAGFNTRHDPHHFNEDIDLFELKCVKHVDLHRASHSMGTLGGGNHFIELGQDDDGQLYLIVHSGSRNLGKQVCDYYQNVAADTLGRTKEGDDRALAYLEGSPMSDYLHDMGIVQQYADLNRRAIARDISKQAKFKIVDTFSVVHNYIDLDAMILRKGAVSARSGDCILVPMNMRDGSLLCVGKGNANWNFSAPHGAGRVMSRKEAKEKITLIEYEKSMKGICSSTVNRATIDEAPQAYKPMNEIIENSRDTMEVVKIIKPLYNFKAGNE